MRQGLLKLTVVGVIRTGPCRHKKPLVDLGRPPAPVFHMAIEKGQIAALPVPICCQGVPILRITIQDNPLWLFDDEKPRINALLVLVNKGKHAGRRRQTVLAHFERSPVGSPWTKADPVTARSEALGV